MTLTARQRDELATKFEERLDGKERALWRGLMYDWDLFTDDEIAAFANGIRWVKFSYTHYGGGLLSFSDRHFSGGHVGGTEPWFTEYSDARELAAILGLPFAESTLAYDAWGDTGLEDGAVTKAVARAQAAWARRRFRIGHPLHPNTHA